MCCTGSGYQRHKIENISMFDSIDNGNDNDDDENRDADTDDDAHLKQQQP